MSNASLIDQVAKTMYRLQNADGTGATPHPMAVSVGKPDLVLPGQGGGKEPVNLNNLCSGQNNLVPASSFHTTQTNPNPPKNITATKHRQSKSRQSSPYPAIPFVPAFNRSQLFKKTAANIISVVCKNAACYFKNTTDSFWNSGLAIVGQSVIENDDEMMPRSCLLMVRQRIPVQKSR